MAKAKQATKKDTVTTTAADKEKATPAPMKQAPKKPPLRDRILSALMPGSAPQKLSETELKDRRERATARAELLVSRIEASITGHGGKYPREALAGFRVELNAIRSGTWTGPGMGRSKRREEPSFYSIGTDHGYSASTQKAEDKADEILMGD